MTDLQKQNKGGAIQSDSLNPSQLLEKAVQGNANVDVMERLLSLQERWEQKEAKKAYDRAMSDLRGDLPDIVKTKSVSHKGGSYQYEDLSDVTSELAPVMADHGLSFRWKTDIVDGEIVVKCIISHEDGHSEETQLKCRPDKTGSKNDIQAIGSAVTYLQRYTLKAAVGVAAGPDDDAQSVGDSEGGDRNQSNQHDDRETEPCPIHDGQKLVKRTKDDGSKWWSHQFEDGEWCNADPLRVQAQDAVGEMDLDRETVLNYLEQELDVSQKNQTPERILRRIVDNPDGFERAVKDWKEEQDAPTYDEDLTIEEVKEAHENGELSLQEIIEKEEAGPNRKGVLKWANAKLDREAKEDEAPEGEPQPIDV